MATSNIKSIEKRLTSNMISFVQSWVMEGKCKECHVSERCNYMGNPENISCRDFKLKPTLVTYEMYRNFYEEHSYYEFEGTAGSHDEDTAHVVLDWGPKL